MVLRRFSIMIMLTCLSFSSWAATLKVVGGSSVTSSTSTSDTATLSETLQQANVTLYLDTSDANYNSLSNLYPDDLFTEDTGTDTCYGDSGGPLLYSNILYGVTSFGLSDYCGTGLPSGYTNLGLFRTWIDQTINNYTATTTNSSSDDSSSSGGGGSIDFMLFFILIPVAGLRWYQRLRL